MRLITTNTQLTKPLVWLEVSTQALLSNVRKMKTLVGNTKIMAVLKANAYGLGGVGVARTIEQDVDAFGVVGINEALALRTAGVKKQVVNLGMYTPEDALALIENDIAPNIFTDAALKNFDRASKKCNKSADIWIKVDTGLCRLGVPYREAASLIRSAKKMRGIAVQGVSSSFTEDETFDREQLKRFLAVKKQCQKENIAVPLWSIASSEAAFMFEESTLNMARLGISILGYYPSAGAQATNKIILQPSATYKTRVACVKEIEKGESVFYRKKFIAKKKIRIAVLLPGYSYGLSPALVDGSDVLIREKKYPLVGGISATNCFVDIGTNNEIDVNDEVVLFGKQGDAEIMLNEVCTLTKQNPYECLSRIPEKVQRIYV